MPDIEYRKLTLSDGQEVFFSGKPGIGVEIMVDEATVDTDHKLDVTAKQFEKLQKSAKTPRANSATIPDSDKRK